MLHSGIYYPSDIEAGFALGREVGQRAVAWAQTNPPDLSPVDELNGGEGSLVWCKPDRCELRQLSNMGDECT